MKNLFGEEEIWRVSAKWALTKITCNDSTRKTGCLGACCKGNYYPARIDGGRCFYLGRNGCKLSISRRPIICLLYPFVLRKGTLVLDINSIVHTCKANMLKKAMPIIWHMEEEFTELFGGDQYERLINDVLRKKKDSYLIVPEKVSSRIRLENTLKSNNGQLTKRYPQTGYVIIDPMSLSTMYRKWYTRLYSKSRGIVDKQIIAVNAEYSVLRIKYITVWNKSTKKPTNGYIHWLLVKNLSIIDFDNNLPAILWQRIGRLTKDNIDDIKKGYRLEIKKK